MLRARGIELRKLLSFLVILIIAIALCSCTKNDKTNQEAENNTTKNQTQNTYEEGTSSVAVADWDYSYAIEAPTITDTDVKWNLILVNRDNYLPDNYIDTINLVNVCGTQERLDSRAATYYEEMFNAAATEGIYLTPCSGYRSYDLQKSNFENRISYNESLGYSKTEATLEASKVILPPGTSEHNAGLAMDIVNCLDSFENTQAFQWLYENAQDFGFILRYPKDKQDITKIVYEPWHWRFVGVEAAQEMKKSGQCLEEYLGKVK